MPNNTESNSFIRQTGAGQDRIQALAFVISVCMCVLSSLAFISGFGNAGQPSGVELESRINPNDAPAASLIRLPGIGTARALAIVAYRENFGKKDSSNPAFRSCDDLQKVKGIGPKTVQNISEWLKFE
jgi:competence ComEA-like helix-hairpin-helix protein